MTLLAPGAHLIPVANTAGDRMNAMLGLVLHVQEGNGSPAGWFNNPQAQASSTWWVAKDGRLEQYADDPRTRMWAQGDGNESYCSIESEGFTNEPLTDAQLDTLARLFAWGHQTLGWVYATAEAPGQRGLGWHGMGGNAWGGHFGCPGDIRKGQRQTVINKAKGGTNAPAPNPSPTPVPAAKGKKMLILTIGDGPGGSFLVGASPKSVHIPNQDVAALKAAGVPEAKVSGALIHELTA